MKWSWMLRGLYLWRSWLALLVYRSMHLGPSTAHKDSFLWPSGSLPLPQSNTGQTWSSPLGGGWSLHRFSYHSYRKCLEGKWQCHIGTSRIIWVYTFTHFGSYLYVIHVIQKILPVPGVSSSIGGATTETVKLKVTFCIKFDNSHSYV